MARLSLTSRGQRPAHVVGALALGVALVLSGQTAAGAVTPAAAKKGGACSVANAVSSTANGKTTLVCRVKGAKGTWRTYPRASVTVAIASAVFLPKEEVAMYAVPKAMGYFEAENLDVRIVNTQGSVDAAQQVVAGNVDVAWADLGPGISAVDKGGDAVIIGGIVQNWPWRMLTLPNSSIKTGADLKGKKVGIISTASGSNFFARSFVTNSGLQLSDVQFVPTGQMAASVAALKNGTIDAYASYTAVIEGAIAAGESFGTLKNPASFNGVRSLSWTVRRSSLAEKREIYERLMRATQKGLVFSSVNPTAATKMGYKEISTLLGSRAEADALKADVPQLKAWVASATPLKGKPVTWNRMSDIPATDILATQGFAIGANQLVKVVPVARAYDGSIITRANRWDRKLVVAAAEKAK